MHKINIKEQSKATNNWTSKQIEKHEIKERKGRGTYSSIANMKSSAIYKRTNII